jgi:excisionase family DNA binding protein
MADLENYVTSKDAAKMLRVCRSRIDQFCRAGRLTFVMVGNARLILRADVERMKATDRPVGVPLKPRKKPTPRPKGK